MGNFISHRSSSLAGKVILLDGTIHEFDLPITVAELMLEYPQQVVVEFRPALKVKRPTPLPADKQLDTNKAYLMLPMKRGNKLPALSSEDARRVVSSANSMLQSRCLLKSLRFVLPLFAKICPAEQRVVVEKEMNVAAFMPELLDGRSEYLSRTYSGRGWKPSLDTIKEKKVTKKGSFTGLF